MKLITITELMKRMATELTKIWHVQHITSQCFGEKPPAPSLGCSIPGPIHNGVLAKPHEAKV